MRAAAAVLAAALAAAAGCQLFGLDPLPKKRLPAPPTFSQYHLDGWDWGRVDRVLVLPFLNESAYTRAGRETQAALTSELQRLGQFEVVAGPPDDQALLARIVHRGGRFDEAVMLDIGRTARADVVVHGTITQYSPYPRPRLGLVLQAVGPREAKVVASVDGLWDTTDGAIAERCRTFYRQRPRQRPPWIRNHVIASDDSFAGELALDSPALFQRFVCHEAALALLGLPIPWVVDDPGAAVPCLPGGAGFRGPGPNPVP
ncbi:MAG: hypothetical protein JWO38_6407 [Gemmataceae bacterium]|nr:hypothetical protein [Gemmataceae bacterium]